MPMNVDIPNTKYIQENTNVLFANQASFRTTQPFQYIIGNMKITVPSGFVTDGASIPQWALTLMSFVRGCSSDRFSHEWISAAIVHDYLTRYNYDRRTADAVFHYILTMTTDRFTAFIMWLAVRAYSVILR